MSNLKKNRDERGQFSLSAMIDVVFLLLIFFVVTFIPPRMEAHLAVHQPGDPTPGPERPSLETEVHPNGYWFMGRPMSLDTLEGHLMTVALAGNETAVFIKVNPSAQEGQLIDLLDRCKKVDLNNLNIQTLKAGYDRPSVQ
jgi:biopolymer transport protein ExbD